LGVRGEVGPSPAVRRLGGQVLQEPPVDLDELLLHGPRAVVARRLLERLPGDPQCLGVGVRLAALDAGPVEASVEVELGPREALEGARAPLERGGALLEQRRSERGELPPRLTREPRLLLLDEVAVETLVVERDLDDRDA